MKLPALSICALALAALVPSAHASLELAQKSGCTGCHGLENKIVGPAYRDVAKKYAGKKDAAQQLADSIRKGGMGQWGPVPMPAQPQLSDADVKTLAAWLAAGAK